MAYTRSRPPRRAFRHGVAVGVVAAVAVMVGAIVFGPAAPSVFATTVSARLPPPTSFHCTVGTGPRDPAYDPVNHYLYVPNIGSANISVIAPPCTVVATISLLAGSEPDGAVFSPTNDRVYVTDAVADEVYIISNTTIVGTITKGAFHCPWYPTFDPGDNAIAIPNECGHTVTFLQLTTGLTTTVPVGSHPWQVAYDPYYAALLVANLMSDNVTILSAVYLTHTTDAPVGLFPDGIAYYPSCACDMVANDGSSNVSLLYGNGGPHASIFVGAVPAGVAWDQKSLDMFVANYGAHNISVIHGLSVVRTITLPVSSAEPEGLAYSDFNNMVYVTDFANGVVYAYS